MTFEKHNQNSQASFSCIAGKTPSCTSHNDAIDHTYQKCTGHDAQGRMTSLPEKDNTMRCRKKITMQVVEKTIKVSMVK